MGEVRPPEPVLLFVGLLIAPSCPLPSVYESLEQKLGPIESKSPVMDFNFTRYYESEMGAVLSRQFLVFERLVLPDKLPGIKVFTNDIEKTLEADGKRCVNIDPGYLTGARLVLVTTKDHAHRLYLGQGIYGEITLLFQRGAYEALPWTYPDYRSQPYQDFFKETRRKYLERLSKERLARSTPDPRA